jgi:hypothetical protein
VGLASDVEELPNIVVLAVALWFIGLVGWFEFIPKLDAFLV